MSKIAKALRNFFTRPTVVQQNIVSEGDVVAGDNLKPRRPDLESAEEMIFQQNMEEFVTTVNYYVNLEIGGKLKQLEAYEAIKKEMKKLKKSKKSLLD